MSACTHLGTPCHCCFPAGTTAQLPCAGAKRPQSYTPGGAQQTRPSMNSRLMTAASKHVSQLVAKHAQRVYRACKAAATRTTPTQLLIVSGPSPHATPARSGAEAGLAVDLRSTNTFWACPRLHMVSVGALNVGASTRARPACRSCPQPAASCRGRPSSPGT